jgi:hypothetical protein
MSGDLKLEVHDDISTMTTNTRNTYIIFLTFIGIFAYALFMTWLKWGDLVVDTFRDLWVPMQLIDGRVLYKDIFYEYGFFPPYSLSIIYRLFDANIITMVSFGLLITILESICLFNICRLFMNDVLSLVLILNFILVFALNRLNGMIAIFSYILPYSFAMLFFVLFVTISLLYFLRFIFSNHFNNLWVWNISIILAFLSRADLSLIVWAAFLLCGITITITGLCKLNIQLFVYLLIPVPVSISAYLIFLAFSDGYAGFRESVVNHIVFQISGQSTFTRDMLTGGNIILGVIVSFICLCIVIASLVFLTHSLSEFKSFRNNKSSVCQLFIAMSAFAISLALIIYISYNNGFYISMSVAMALGALCLASKLAIHSIDSLSPDNANFPYRLHMAKFSLFVVSGGFAARVLFRTIPDKYGTYLLALALVCLYVFYIDIAKYLLKINNCDLTPRALSIVLALWFMCSVLPYWIISLNNYGATNAKLVTEKGSIYCYNAYQTDILNQTIRYIVHNIPERSSMVVIPEGIGINALTQRNNPLRYYYFIPPALAFIGENRLLSSFESARVEYILLVHRPTSEYGPKRFGVDYAIKLNGWIKEHYELLAIFGAFPFTTEMFGTAIYKRK